MTDPVGDKIEPAKAAPRRRASDKPGHSDTADVSRSLTRLQSSQEAQYKELTQGQQDISSRQTSMGSELKGVQDELKSVQVDFREMRQGIDKRIDDMRQDMDKRVDEIQVSLQMLLTHAKQQSEEDAIRSTKSAARDAVVQQIQLQNDLQRKELEKHRLQDSRKAEKQAQIVIGLLAAIISGIVILFASKLIVELTVATVAAGVIFLTICTGAIIFLMRRGPDTK